MTTFDHSQHDGVSGRTTEREGMYEQAAASVLSLYGQMVDGDAMSSLCIISSAPLADAAKSALSASAERLGYGREGCAWIVAGTIGADKVATTDATDAMPNAVDVGTDAVTTSIGADDLRTIVEGLDPIAIITTDATASALLCDAYSIETPNAQPNDTLRINGRTIVMLDDFSNMLQDDDAKQLAWRLMKRIRLGR